ncbi:branched-chain amino acid ABC transporter permease [Geodermatophilus sp. URMC 62]|uniref:branched-chain amino acid ABC transporter permease n=1 Tax=Geodermatophilus sp. URMC 62 TaxID=3423414 RepID=UPI00406BF10B
MTEFLQQTVSGLTTGLVYAALALAIALVFQGTGTLNFAQGEFATLAAFVAFALSSAGLSWWLVVPLLVVLAFLFGAGVERLLVRPVEGSSPLALLTVTAALLLGTNAVVALVWGTDVRAAPSPFGGAVYHLGPLTFTAQALGGGALVLVAMLVCGLVFRATPLGLRLRAVADNPGSAQLLGISTGLMLAVGWGMAAAVGAVAGLVAAPTLGLSPELMTSPLLLALAAATLGGFSSRIGAVVGGLLIGVLSNLASRYVPGIGGDLQLVVPFAVIFVVLLVRPQGLFGRASTVRA